LEGLILFLLLGQNNIKIITQIVNLSLNNRLRAKTIYNVIYQQLCKKFNVNDLEDLLAIARHNGYNLNIPASLQQQFSLKI
ncbi:hypothetical protein MEO41_29165, partial [Dolichospermum sp. ST_sed4]|nr:hypothetical protein [Dolichospermum sp. ST_sed4]